MPARWLPNGMARWLGLSTVLATLATLGAPSLLVVWALLIGLPDARAAAMPDTGRGESATAPVSHLAARQTISPTVSGPRASVGGSVAKTRSSRPITLPVSSVAGCAAPLVRHGSVISGTSPTFNGRQDRCYSPPASGNVEHCYLHGAAPLLLAELRLARDFALAVAEADSAAGHHRSAEQARKRAAGAEAAIAAAEGRA